MDYETIIYTKSDNVATITLNRPEARNALNPATIEDLIDSVHRCDADPDVRAIILTGSGKVFCSGGDLKASKKRLAGSATLDHKKFLNMASSMFVDFRRVGLPIIAAVNGPAVGGGFSLALACDLVIAARSAWFNSQFIMIGNTPDGGLSYMLPRMAGLKRATWLLFTGERVDAQRGYEMGFVNQVTTDSELINEANALAKRLAEGPTLAIARTKKLINMSMNESFETQLENEKESIYSLYLTEDRQEALNAFLEKRTPKFKGR